ncbi:baseplate J/gp47 family protein [Geomicrobium sediminis]|uniref:Phage protein gp47/JayE n=1 Tax=Geomicrobium sediminis TaxID=1347788 RepID=A0ABS2P700_9BACL|nr:baseplate J/gp47 family protein [Geomicrobium sediminis]MBM7631092.1 putative phage protein gp47/JayE [Geomicrobium sediminis]
MSAEREREIHQEILDGISDDHEKIPGAPVYDWTRPPARKFAEYEQQQDRIAGKLDVRNLTGDELESYINQRTGQERQQSTHAIGQVLVVADGTVPAGARFETVSGIEYEVLEATPIDEEGRVDIRAVESGPIGVVPANQIIEIPVTLEGVVSVTNPEPTYDGFSAESDDDLLQRYYKRIRTPATSGNRFHYENWALEVTGVGAARVFPLWDGDNTVKVVIIDADRLPASDELVAELQEYLDPGITGKGDGQAPIGAYVTAESAADKAISLSFTLSVAGSAEVDEVIEGIETDVTAYLREIAFEQDFVSYAAVGAIILAADGVADYTDLLVNGDNQNVAIGEQEVAVLGGVDVDT